MQLDEITKERKKLLNPDPKLYLRMVLTVSVVHVSRRAINVSRLRPRGASKRHYPKISTTKIPPRFESTACLTYYDCISYALQQAQFQSASTLTASYVLRTQNPVESCASKVGHEQCDGTTTTTTTTTIH